MALVIHIYSVGHIAVALHGRNDGFTNRRIGVILSHASQGDSIIDDKGHAFSMKVAFNPVFYMDKPALPAYDT